MNATSHEKAIADIDRVLAYLDRPPAPPKKLNPRLAKKKHDAEEMAIRDNKDYAVVELEFENYQIYPMSLVIKNGYKYVWSTGGGDNDKK